MQKGYKPSSGVPTNHIPHWVIETGAGIYYGAILLFATTILCALGILILLWACGQWLVGADHTPSSADVLTKHQAARRETERVLWSPSPSSFREGHK